MCAKSLQVAQELAQQLGNSPSYAISCNQGIFVGGMASNEEQLTVDEMRLIRDSDCALANAEIMPVAFSFRSLLKPQQCPNGRLYRHGECVIFEHNDAEHVAEIAKFLCVNIESKYHKFVVVKQFCSKLQDDQDEVEIDEHTGYKIVSELQPTISVFPVTSLSRKAMLYPSSTDEDAKIVIDFQRTNLAITSADIVVPYYPVVGDMIHIKADNELSESWLAKVLGIQERRKTVKIHYYNRDASRPTENIYIPESNFRLAQDYISWDSVICCAVGEWNEESWEI